MSDKKKQSIEISVNDGRLLLNLVRVATIRGAIRAEELTTIGKTFDLLTVKLKPFEESSEPKPKARRKAKKAPTPPPEEEERLESVEEDVEIENEPPDSLLEEN